MTRYVVDREHGLLWVVRDSVTKEIIGGNGYASKSFATTNAGLMNRAFSAGVAISGPGLRDACDALCRALEAQELVEGFARKGDWIPPSCQEAYEKGKAALAGNAVDIITKQRDAAVAALREIILGAPVVEPEGDFDDMEGAESHGSDLTHFELANIARAALADSNTGAVCCLCGCDDEHACPGGCSWANHPTDATKYICSACVPKLTATAGGEA
ncbi:MAG: hypothetical protein ACREJD_09540 [Phycisphaerales bacterium]